MYVVGYLYNNNGMASWCWEAAHAMTEAGLPVLLVVSSEVKLPGNPKVDILRFDQPYLTANNKSFLKLIQNEISRLSNQSSGFVGSLHIYLQSKGINPTAYFLNQSNLQDPSITVPQHVVAWAYPTSLLAYVSKIGKLTGWKPSKNFIRTCLDSVGWWRKDWRAYRSATSVLAVSEQLNNELKIHGIKTRVVYPGTYVQEVFISQSFNNDRKPRLLIVSVGLEDSRKRVRWMLQALKLNPARNYSLSLIGFASDDFKEWVHQDEFPVNFLGLLPRDEVQKVMAEHDIFLFGSCLDDWGYVLVEAMSQGLAVIAPNIHPFNEIVGETGSLYSVDSQSDFCQKLNILLADDLSLKKYAAWERAKTLFSRKTFAENLLES